MTSRTRPLSGTTPLPWKASKQAIGKTQNATQQGIVGALLLLSATGTLFNNVLIASLDTFSVDLTHVLMLVTTLAAAITAKRVNPRIVIGWLGFMSLELIHALLFDLAADPEWVRSTAQVGAYSLAFVVISGIKLDRHSLRRIGSSATVVACAIGGFAILQFSLANAFDVHLNLPDELQTAAHAVAFEDVRYVGIARAMALSREPAELGFGLATLVAILIFLDSGGLIKRSSYMIAVLAALGGVIVTLSPTGLITVIAILLGTWLLAKSATSSRHWHLPTAITLVVLAGLIAPLGERLQSIYQGTDVSSLVRVEAAVRLLVDLPDDPELLAFGTGLGLEVRDIGSYLKTYQPLVPWNLSGEIRMHSILAVVRFQQGLLGLLAYLFLWWLALYLPRKARGAGPSFAALIPVIVAIVMFLFSSGYYASPIHWSLMALMTVLRHSNWKCDQEVQSVGPAD